MGAPPSSSSKPKLKSSGGTAAGSDPLDAIDGDPLTAWRGAKGASNWVFTATFRRVVHVGLVRLYLGDTAERGVPELRTALVEIVDVVGEAEAALLDDEVRAAHARRAASGTPGRP